MQERKKIMKCLKILKKEAGTVLILTMVVVLIVSALGMAYTMSSVSGSRLLQSQYRMTRATCLAEGALEQAIFDLAYNRTTYSIPATGSMVWRGTDGSEKIAHPNGGTYAISAALRTGTNNQGVITATGEFRNCSSSCSSDCTNSLHVTRKTISVVVVNTSSETTSHQLFYKAIYAGNKSGVADYTFELTGHTTSTSDTADEVVGPIHIEGDVITSVNGATTITNGNSTVTATGTIKQVDGLGTVVGDIAGTSPGSLSITPPQLSLTSWSAPDKQYKSWDSEYQGASRSVVHVKDEFDHYTSTSELKTVPISCESSSAWNDTATMPPDSSAANFFMDGYQFHYVNGFTTSDDTAITKTGNYYLGARNGGEITTQDVQVPIYTRVWTGRYDRRGRKIYEDQITGYRTETQTITRYGNNGDASDDGTSSERNVGYGGGHSVIPVSAAQNNKVYYVEGNVWLDSDGSNHLFFVPGPDLGDAAIRLTIVAQGNIYIGDQVFVHGDATSLANCNEGQSSLTNTWSEAVNVLNADSALALIAMGDGESFTDANNDGKYNEGETILNRDDDSTPKAASNNPVAEGTFASGYQGRLEGSGNLIFGDTINGPVGSVEAFLYADNNFTDITVTNNQSSQGAYVLGNMSAGNAVDLQRNWTEWDTTAIGSYSSLPTGWVAFTAWEGSYYGGSNVTRYYPPGTTSADISNAMVVTRCIRLVNGSYQVYARKHTPLKVSLDSRIVSFSSDDVAFLPGLPKATIVNTSEGYWKPVLWLNE